MKEVNKLDIFTMFTYTTYYDTSTPSWDVVVNSIYYFWIVP